MDSLRTIIKWRVVQFDYPFDDERRYVLCQKHWILQLFRNSNTIDIPQRLLACHAAPLWSTRRF